MPVVPPVLPPVVLPVVPDPAGLGVLSVVAPPELAPLELVAVVVLGVVFVVVTELPVPLGVREVPISELEGELELLPAPVVLPAPVPVSRLHAANSAVEASKINSRFILLL